MACATLHLGERIRRWMPGGSIRCNSAQSELKRVGHLVDRHDELRDDEMFRTHAAERVLGSVEPKPHARSEDLYLPDPRCKNVGVCGQLHQLNLVAPCSSPSVFVLWVHKSTDTRGRGPLFSLVGICTYGDFPRRLAVRLYGKFAFRLERATSTCATEVLRVARMPLQTAGRPGRATRALGSPNAYRSCRSHASATFRKGGRA